MRQPACPRCGTPISYWGRQRAQSGRLLRVGRPLACPNCGAALRWSIGRWQPVQTAILMLGIGLLTWLLVSDAQRDRRPWIILGFCLAAGGVRIVLELLATRLVEDDGD